MADKNLTGVGRDANPDPITKTPGSHPVGTGVGAAAGGAAVGLAGAAVAGAAVAGAATGAALTGPAAPIGAVVGAVVGAVAGGLAGKAVAEKVDPTAEDAYWRANHRPGADAGDYDYDRDFGPAYRHGYTAAGQHPGRKYEEVESQLKSGWAETKGDSRLGWDKAKIATRAAWHRVERAMPGDADRDGR